MCPTPAAGSCASRAVCCGAAALLLWAAAAAPLRAGLPAVDARSATPRARTAA
eukprot:gene26076-65289_t